MPGSTASLAAQMLRMATHQERKGCRFPRRQMFPPAMESSRLSHKTQIPLWPMEHGMLTSSSTMRPNMSSMKALLLRCSQEAWQKAEVIYCHHLG